MASIPRIPSNSPLMRPRSASKGEAAAPKLTVDLKKAEAAVLNMEKAENEQIYKKENNCLNQLCINLARAKSQAAISIFRHATP